MSESPEEFGPLTPEQEQEMLRHPLNGQYIHELEEDVKYYSRILKDTPKGDPVHRRFTAQLESTQRYINLRRRFDQYGVATIFDLDKVHDTRR